MGYRFTQANSQAFYGEYPTRQNRTTQSSMSFWFRWLGGTAGCQIMGMYDGGSQHYWQFGLNQGLNYANVPNGMYQVFTPISGAGKYVVSPNSSWFDGSWTNVVSVRDSSTTAIYVNGVLQSKGSGSTNPGTSSLQAKGLNGIGCQNRCDINTADGFIDGEMAEVAQWDTALTQADVDSLQHVVPTYIKPESLRSYVPLHDGVSDYGPLNMSAPNWTPTASAPTDANNHPSVVNYTQPIVVTADFDGGGGGGGGSSERRAKLVRDVTAGLTRNLSRNLYNFEAAPLGAG